MRSRFRIAAPLPALLLCAELCAADVAVGPKNVDLQDGMRAIAAGDAKTGLELTRRGLDKAIGKRDRRIGYNNLCAAHVMLEQVDAALPFCNAALAIDPNSWRAYNNRALIYVLTKRFPEAEADLVRAERLNPKASSLRFVRRLLNRESNPVIPIIEIDDRRTSDMGAGDEPL